MEKPAVTMEHKEAYATFGAMTFLFLVIVALNCVTADCSLIGFAIAALCLAVAGLFLFMAKCSETMDENGIRIHTPFSEKQYSWDDVQSVGIAKPSSKDLPKIEIKVDKSVLYIDYTKRSRSCIHYYYGEPDWDKYGKPPSIF